MRRLTAFFALALMVLAPAANAQVVLGAVNTGTSSYTTGETRPLQLNADGSLKVGGAGGAGPVGVAQGAATAGQTETLVACSTTTAAPTYVTGTTNPCNSTTSGEIRVQIGQGGASTSLRSLAGDGLSTVVSGLVVQSYNAGWNGTSYDRLRTVGGFDGTGIGVQGVVQAPCAAVNCGVASVRNVAVGSAQVIKASAGNLYDWQVTSGASAGYVLIFNAITAPADGAVTPAQCVAVAANTTVGSGMTLVPEYFSTGITVVFSTTGCFTKTASATAFIRGRAQ